MHTYVPDSPGSPILLPNGARIFNRLVEFLRNQYVRYGFDEVITPTIYKKALWAKSGHLENYSDDMFTVMSTSPSRSDTTEGGEEEEYALKPMNCPGHCLIFASQRRSYRDLPIRYADFSPLHRNEISGALSGLTRVRRFHQDDGHIFCRPIQIEEEIKKTLDFVRVVYSTLRLGPYRLALSTRPSDHTIGTTEDWESAENALKRALDASGQDWTINEGDGAFYGPKIDIVLRDSDGKEHQTATIQLDFQLPKRFNLCYDAPAPESERRGLISNDPVERANMGLVQPVLIHRAVLGSVERLMALLIEHYNGEWPLWLNPRQVMILTVNDKEPVVALARSVQNTLMGRDGPTTSALSSPSQLAVDIDDSARPLGTKVTEAREKGYSVLVTVGPRQVPTGSITVQMGALEGSDATPGQGAGSKGKKQVDMMPSELLQLLKAKAEAYDHRCILASASPRRRTLLSQVGLGHLEVLPSGKPENLPKDAMDPFAYVSATAAQKALDVPEKGDPDLVVAADTVIVTRDGAVLEKPGSEAQHKRMLRHLRDTRVHRVLTAVCAVAPKADASHPGYEMASHVEETKVWFAREADGLPDDVIDAYVKTREGVDKAGGYAVQGIGGMVLVEKVEGSVDNVVGLPVRKTLQLCEKVVFRQGEEEEDKSDEEE
ncbi:hypothetical protein F5Y15DRAFT_407675 [Xylariaceae sp. FL0016]|nr:hypothetical protein F5Y15DRAFT_407675 [Xylariaceae sp. FL0016]